MNIISRYLMRQIFSMTLIVSIAFLGINFFIALANELHNIGKGDYTLSRALWYVCLILPHDFYQIFPIAGLLGCLLALGLLANHSELTVMRAAGVSIAQLLRKVLIIIMLMTATATILGEYYAPRLLNIATRMRTMDKHHGQIVATQQGIWIRDGQDFIHVGTVLGHHELSDVTHFHFDTNHHLTALAWAETAAYRAGHWTLKNVQRSVFLANQVIASQLPEEIWEIHMSPSILRVTDQEPEQMSLKKLYRIMQFKQQNQLEYADFALSFWQRVIQPLSTCVMLLLAVPFVVFGSLRQVSMGSRIIWGLSVGFTFYLLNQFFVPFGTLFAISPIIAALLPTLLCIILGGWLLWRSS